MDLTPDRRKYRTDLFRALIREEGDRVIELCRQYPEGALHKVTIHEDTVLHIATSSKQKDLVLNLLKELPEDQLVKLTQQNSLGHTVLHEAATSDKTIPAAREMLRKAPNLLSMRNTLGETALFLAARYGNTRMFEFLDDEVNKSVYKNDLKNFHFRKDKCSILHVSIISEHFDLALSIARKYGYLIGERDGQGMIALQLLACNSSTFKSWRTRRASITQSIYSCISSEATTTVTDEEVETCCTVPLWNSIRGQANKTKSALKIAELLIERDTSWEATETAENQSRVKIHEYDLMISPGGRVKEGQNATTTPTREITTVKTAETALFLACKSGIIEMVKKIIDVYPQAVEHIDGGGRNILHIAIKYRQNEIFDFVMEMKIPMKRMTKKLDNRGNSILHYVGMKEKDRGAEDMRSPAIQLRDDLLWFERVKEICKIRVIKQINLEGKTADVLIRENNADLRKEAKEWIKRTAEQCSIVAVLIATVAFAAAYTIPGGSDQDTGYPLLLSRPFFQTFIVADAFSITCALTSVIVFLSILTSSFALDEFKRSLHQKLTLGLTLLMASVSFMMLAFAATILLLICHNAPWTRIVLYAVGILPVTIFVLSYSRMYAELLKTFEDPIRKFVEALPRCSRLSSRSSTTPPLKSDESQAITISNPSQSQTSSSACHYLQME